MYKNILVPIAMDHEKKGEAALNVAMTLKEADGRITLLHVLEDIPGFIVGQLPEGTMEKNRAAAEAELGAIAKSAGVKADVVWGHSGRTILDYAEEHGVDCIVIASHKPGLEDYFLGSTAARVVRHAPCAVHVIR